MGTSSKDIHQQYEQYLKTQCSYWTPGADEYLAGEIVFQWKAREHIRHTMCHQQAEMTKIDGVLSGLLFEMKKKLSRLGRSGRWTAWLKQRGIPRSTADRLVLDHCEYFGLTDELRHRTKVEPLEGNICQHAYRTTERMAKMLTTPKSRIVFTTVLADLLGLKVEFGENESVCLTLPPAPEDSDYDPRVPNVVELQAGGKVVPVNYELQDEEVL